MPEYGYLLPTRGIVLSSDDNSSLASKIRADVVGLASRAEALGFDSVWVGDSVLAKPRLEPLTTLASVATATEAVDVGTAVYLPVLRNPVHVAHATATVDQISGGRLRFGIGVGIGSDVEAEYRNLDVPFPERGARMDELLEILTQLWTGESVDYDGRFYQLRGASIGFGPVRTPPIYIPTAAFDPTEGFPRSIRERLVTYGDGWLPTSVTPETYAASLETVRELLDQVDRGPSSFDPAAYVDVVVDDDEDAAIETARAFYDRYYTARDPMTDEEIKSGGAFGSPSQVADRIDDYADAGVETILVRFTASNQRVQLQRFTDVVEVD